MTQGVREPQTLQRNLEIASSFLRLHPSAAQVVLRADATSVGRLGTRVECGAHSLTADEPRLLGGAGLGPSPVEHVLAALGSCLGIAYRLWAAKLGMPLSDVSVVVEGDYDVRGLLGLSDDGRPALSAVRVTATVDGLSREEATCLHSVVNEHCPVLDLFEHGIPVTTNWEA